MYQNKLPMTSSNIRQFEAYQNGTNQLLNDIRKISQNITDMIRSDIREDAAHNPSALLRNISTGQDLSGPSDTTSSPLQSAASMNRELVRLSSAVGQQISNLPDLTDGEYSNLMKQVADGDSSLADAIRLLDKLYADTQTGNRPAIAQTVQGLLNQLTLQPQTSDTASSFSAASTSASLAADSSSQLLNQYLASQDTTPMLSTVFNPQERANLSNNLSSLLNGQTVIDNIAQGSASFKETLSFIMDNLPMLDKSSAEKLLQAPEYSKLLEEAFLQKWTITPEKASKKDSVSNLYHQLTEDLEKLSNLTKSLKDSEENQRLDTPIKNMKENLQFMKDLNEAFTYLQLPMKFKDQTAHTDLYVMRRKKSLSDSKENLSVLLHLDMSNLGSLNIYIQMNSGNRIQADFYIEDTDAGLLIKENLPSLTNALEKKGYSLDADVKDSYQKPDFSKDFIEQNSQDNLIQRYTFDIRT
jgi:hypothetical protein